MHYPDPATHPNIVHETITNNSKLFGICKMKDCPTCSLTSGSCCSGTIAEGRTCGCIREDCGTTSEGKDCVTEVAD